MGKTAVYDKDEFQIAVKNRNIRKNGSMYTVLTVLKCERIRKK